MRSGPSILAALLLVPLLRFGASLREGGAALDEELGRELELALTDVKPWPGPFPESLGRSVAEKLQLQPDFLAGVRVFQGRGTIPGSQKPEDLVLVRLGLTAPLAGARLVCAVHADGRLAHAAIHGRAE